MLDLITRYNLSGTEKPIVHWHYMCDVISERINIYTERVSKGSTPVVPWIHLIKTLLMRIPIEILNKPTSTIMAYALGDIVDKLDNYLCPNYKLKVRYNQFISTKNNIPVQEYIVPCRSVTPLIDLPTLDRSAPMRAWAKIKPIRILYCDTFELCGDFLHMTFNYKEAPPTQVVVAIDTPALVLKYLAYCNEQIRNKEPVYLNYFIRTHLIDNLYGDLVNCWIFQMLEAGAIDNNLDEKRIISYPLICTESNIERAKLDLNKYWANLSNKTYQYGDFVHTTWLLDQFPYTTIYEYAQFLKHSITMPMLNQNAYIRFMIELPLVKLIIKLNCLNKTAISMKMNKEFRFKLVRLYRSNILKAVPCDPSITNRLLKEVKHLIDLCEDVPEDDDVIDPESVISISRY